MGDAAERPDFSHQYTSEIVCPHCGHAHSDSWEISGDTYECHGCEKKFRIERDTDVTYSTFIPKPEPPKPKPPKPDLSFLIGEPDAEPRTGDISVHDTTVAVWEEHVEASLSEVMLGVLARLYRRGFDMERDPDTLKHYPTLANGRWCGRRGALEVLVSLSGRHLEVTFFQSVHLDPGRAKQPNGGRYQHEKYQWMPERMRLECVTELVVLVRRLLQHGYALSEKGGLSRPILLPLAVRDAVDGRWPENETPLEFFRRSGWGPSRNDLDETGFLSEKAYTSGYPGRGLDRDGVLIRPGDTRYFYRNGHLVRCAVYPFYNGQWFVAVGGEIDIVHHGDELFSCDPTTMPRRFVQGQVERLHREVEGALKKKDYRRVAAVGRALARVAERTGGKGGDSTGAAGSGKAGNGR